MSWHICVWSGYNGRICDGFNDPIYHEHFDDYDSAADKAETVLKHGIKLVINDVHHWFPPAGIVRLRIGQDCSSCTGCKLFPELQEE